jgi:hypothetical protein
MLKKTATRQLGWRLPGEIVARVQALAKAEGTRPGKLVAALLLRHFEGEHVWTAKELAKRVRFPANIGKWH